jgi:Na+-transporting NADH:ubiquinone oxidoreductase subunit B
VVGLGIEFAWAQWKHEEIQEGYLVTGILIPLIIPVSTPIWILVIAIAFAVIFGKEIFGGTGMNIFNVAILTRMFLFFSYPSKMTGDSVWIATDKICGLGNALPDGFTQATPLGQIAQGITPDASLCDMFFGFIPGSVGETSVVAIAIGAVILLWTGVASWKTMLSVFAGGGIVAALFHMAGTSPIEWYEQLILGGFAFGAVFMATDPVTSARTETGKWIYGFFIGAMAVIVRVLNPGYPEGMMLAIFFGNMFAPLIDYCVVQSNISKRANRTNNK